MVGERLFYFIHGFVTMFFLMAGLQRCLRPNAPRLKRLCGYILLYWAFLELKDLLFYAGPFLHNDYFVNLLVLFDMTVIPVVVCFAMEVVCTGWCTSRRLLVNMLPFVIAFFFYIFLPSDALFNALFISTGLYSVVMIVYFYFAIKRHNRFIKDNFSNTDNVSVGWLTLVALMLVACLVLWTVSCYFESWLVDGCYQLALLLLWVVILNYVNLHKPVKVHPAPLVKDTDDAESLLGARLEQLMSDDEVWKNPRLSLADLAMQIGTNRTYLSNYLNSNLNTTFYDYINGYRIEAALRMMHEAGSSRTMAEIAENSGFNSISTFRRVFRRVKGCSFGEYRQRL